VARARLEKTKAKRDAKKKKKPATPDPVNQNTKLTAFLLTAFLLSPFCVFHKVLYLLHTPSVLRRN
jgi:hypothetical protein